MIAYLKGRVQHRGETFIVLRVGDVGYQVYVSGTILANAEPGRDLELHIYHYLGEGIQDLYGFATLDELVFFRMLIGVSGVGPKSAMSVLSLADLGEIKKAIIHGKTIVLTKAAGIGKKNAERIIIDLRNKIDVTGEGGDALPGRDDEDAAAGLMRLGYSKNEADDALSLVDASVEQSEERVRAALKHLGKR